MRRAVVVEKIGVASFGEETSRDFGLRDGRNPHASAAERIEMLARERLVSAREIREEHDREGAENDEQRRDEAAESMAARAAHERMISTRSPRRRCKTSAALALPIEISIAPVEPVMRNGSSASYVVARRVIVV